MLHNIHRAYDAQVPWWLRNGHLQTVVSAFGERKYTAPTRSERRELGDGDFLELNWFDGAGLGDGPVFILLPGMGGDHTSGYVQATVRRLCRHGYCAVVLEHRGGTKPNRLAKFYHAGFIEDLAHTISSFAGVNRPLYGIGFSLGGSMLTRWLAESGSNCGLDAVATVSMTFDLLATARLARRGFNRVYEARVLNWVT